MKRFLVVLLCLLLVLSACTSGGEPVKLRVLASPELADLGPLLEDLRKETGIELEMDFQGTVSMSTALIPGRARHDLAWLSTDRFFQLEFRRAADKGERPLATKTMVSPVVVGITPAKAAELRKGKPDGKLSWADMADAAASGRFRFAMAEPATSTSGLTSLVGVATAAAGTGAALRLEDVKCDKLQGFRTGHTLTADTAAAVADKFAERRDVDAIIGYESTLLTLNGSGRLEAPLELVYPRDGIVQADYPILLLDPAKREAYDKVVSWARSPATQKKLMDRTLRRPITGEVGLDPRLPASIGNSLYFPDDSAVVDKLLEDYAGRAPGRVIFALDFSGSMKGPRIAALRAAFAGLSGGPEGGFDRFYRGERLTVVRFGGKILGDKEFTVNGPQDLDALRAFIATDDFDGNTAVWSALGEAYAKAAAHRRAEPGQSVSIVLMTDGESNSGPGIEEFLRAPRDSGVHTYTVRFGEANPAELARAAEATGGHMVDANSTSLLDAFKEIRGCR
ncbi:VWA domain-containing protein [Amycolatopsis umgeniensis]|uniref:Ca-activated chloride channel family protein n=1 Tax=Amycolatopsis umgeniensis TaxID=336628 RepID=A0A841AXC2_9PSEU|nr:substrate-binding domain-containing protein [Amycolatopsis umgeniensis]MBB5851012.1 Ca-activated chloride channel family protein [Amycolatopsis umgeniensis]